MRAAGGVAPQVQGSQDLAMGFLENRRNKSEQYDSSGDREASGHRAGQTVATP